MTDNESSVDRSVFQFIVIFWVRKTMHKWKCLIQFVEDRPLRQTFSNTKELMNMENEMTKEEAIEQARRNYMELFHDQETKLSNLYDECDELEEGDLEEWRIE